MAGNVNKVILIGNLGADPEVRYTPSGTPVANFRIATNESWTNKDGSRGQRTEWHRIVAWQKTAELCGEYLSKGRQVYVEGRLQTRTWKDNNGNDRYTTEIVANQVVFLGGRGQQVAQNQAQSGVETATAESENLPEAEIPPELEGEAEEVYQNLTSNQS